MLMFFLLYAILQALYGPPVAPFASAGSSNFPGLVMRDVPATLDGEGQTFRTRFTIVQGCLLTIFACVWKAIHPNINSPYDSGWICMKRKVTTTLVALIAPEVILYWALNQRLSAEEIVKEYNKEFAQNEDVASAQTSRWGRIIASIWANISSITHFFKPPSERTTWRGNGQRWATTHGFFIQMGGFILYDNGYPKEVLDYQRLAELLRTKSIDQPDVTKRELQDHSKGDAISKGIVVWQTTSFALQCCARLAQHLPLSELEVVTLAFTVVNFATYAAWWDKPQRVDTAIRLQLKVPEKARSEIPAASMSAKCEAENGARILSTTDTTSRGIHSANQDGPTNVTLSKSPTFGTDDGQSFVSDEQPLIRNGGPRRKETWLSSTLRTDRHNHALPLFLLYRLPYRMIVSIPRLFLKIKNPGEFDRTHLRMPMFYASKNTSPMAEYSLVVVGVIFGAIHFISWDSVFLSHPDQVLWRWSAIVFIVLPSFLFLTAITNEEDSRFDSEAAKTALKVLESVIGWSGVLCALLYIPARFVVIVVALRAIRHPPEGVLCDVAWISFVPHL